MNSKAEITYDDYCAALKKSWEIPLKTNECLPDDVTKWVDKKCKELGVPFAYVAYPFMTAISYCLGVSFVEVFKGYREPVILYTLVSGRSGTNKSASLSKINRFMLSLPGVRQHVYDSGTMEGLMSVLKENDGSVYCAVDEFTTFLDAMDKNSNGHGERFRYLSIWSGSTWSKRTKQGGLNEIKNPRFNFTSFNQNFYFIDLILNNTHYDGFLPRFLIATPDEVYVDLSDKIEESKKREPIKIKKLVRKIYNKFENGGIFTLSEDALKMLIAYDKEVLEAKKEDRFDDLKSMILSKSIGNLLRLAAVQCALRVGVQELNVKKDKSKTFNSDNIPKSQPVPILNDDVPETDSDDFIAGDVTIINNDDNDDDKKNDLHEDENESDEDDENNDVDDANRIRMVIALEDLSAAMTIVRYSISCVLSLVNSTTKSKSKSKKGAKRSFSTMPDSDLIDIDFLIIHKAKIQKLYQEQSKSNTGSKINVSTITKNHIYPQLGGCTGAEMAKKFLLGLEKHGLGKLMDDQKYFSLIDINDSENIPQEVLKLANRLGIKKE